MIYLNLIYLHLIYLPLKFTSILFQNPQMCPAHRDLPTPSHPHSRLNLPHPIPSHTYNGLKTFHSQQPLQAVLLHRLNLSFPAPSHTDTSQPNSRPPQPSTPKKARGCAEGPRLCGPFAVFLFPQKILCTIRQKANATQYLKKSISNLLFLYLTTRTLYIPSISLSSSNALADAALSRSIRV